MTAEFRFLIVATLSLGILSSGVRVNAQSIRSASLARSPSTCTSLPATEADAFGVAVNDRAVLRFIRALSLTGQDAQIATFAALQVPVDPKAVVAIETAATEVPCSVAHAAVYRARMSATIRDVWNVRDDGAMARITDRIGLVAKALTARRSLDPSLLDGLLLPFRASLAELVAPPPASSVSCRVPEKAAYPIRATPPAYPPSARVAGATGMVRDTVDLDSEGDVERVVSLNDTVGVSAGSDSLRAAALIAAATSTYAPALRNCVAVAGSYQFRTLFSGS